MSSAENGRLVWLDDMDVIDMPPWLLAKWRAAPADPVMNVHAAVRKLYAAHAEPFVPPATLDELTAAVLAAVGVPPRDEG